jgi:dethiobiotin synthetase
LSAWFVTSSGTGIGKTLVACALIRQLRRAGRDVCALKPVITGFTGEAAADSDTARLLAALDRPFDQGNVEAVSPWRFKAPLSPHMAAAREDRALDVEEVVAFCRGADRPGQVLLVEGIGGVMVPLSERHTVADWMGLLGFPAILVVGSYLGALSQALSAAAVLQGRGIRLAGMVVAESEDSPVPLADTVDTLARFMAPAPVAAIPRLGDADVCGVAPGLAAALGLISPT